MARKDFGALAGHTTKLQGLQPNATLVEKDDGQIEGVAVFVCDDGNTTVYPEIGDAHPKDSSAELYRIERSYHEVGKITFTCSYIGLTQDPTEPVAQYAGGSNQQPIETHPRFKEFAGDVTIDDPDTDGYVTPIFSMLYTDSDDLITPAPEREKVGTAEDLQTFIDSDVRFDKVIQATGSNSGTTWLVPTGYGIGQNGAKFDLASGSFVNFIDPDNKKCGSSSYINAGDQVIVTYWTKTIPDFARKNKVFTTFPHTDVKVDTDIVSWLCVDMPIQQVGSLDLYQVTEIFLGSSKSEGWDLDVYQENGSPIPLRTDPISL